MVKKAFFIALFVIATFVAVRPALAVTLPSFPSCQNPQGTVRAQFNQGVHGIVGSSLDHNGSDSVFTLSDDAVMQCFCPDNGFSGIQTNWLKVSTFSQQDIDILKRDGWFFIPDGSAWGLDNAPYMARNLSFVCAGGIGGGELLGLAATGGEAKLYSALVAGLAGLTLFFFLKKSSRIKKS